MSLVTVKIFDSGIEAHILKNKLESEGIQSFIHDENIVTLNPLYNFAVGGVKPKVNEEDKERAIEIIREMDDQPYTTDEDEIISCPNCNSTSLYADFKSMKDAKGVFAAITSFVFSVFPIYYQSVYKCKECGTEFKQGEKSLNS
jgi:DNA-directed RNA polymerase subunit RPC12/RpoP